MADHGSGSDPMVATVPEVNLPASPAPAAPLSDSRGLAVPDSAALEEGRGAPLPPSIDAGRSTPSIDAERHTPSVDAERRAAALEAGPRGRSAEAVARGPSSGSGLRAPFVDAAPRSTGVDPRGPSTAAGLRVPPTQNVPRTGPGARPRASSEAGTVTTGRYVDPRIGTTLVGRYRLDRLVGKGGMGRVYRATQLPLRRPVAVKILNPEFQAKDPQFVRRFFLEAATAARLTHPNTITIFDYGESENGELFIAMEYLRGRPLSRLITAAGRFETVRILHVATQICRALREAHSKGIIHRDLKPGNILLIEEGDDPDFVKVLDFGLVKLFHAAEGHSESTPLTPEPSDGDLTKAGMFLGSPKYMSPEQIQGVALDPRTDIYSMGVLMYQMATGRPPFTGTTSVEVIYKHVNEAPPPFSETDADVPPELQAIILRCLSKRRDDRYASMGALLVHLKDARRLLVPAIEVGDGEVDIGLSDLTNSLVTHGLDRSPSGAFGPGSSGTIEAVAPGRSIVAGTSDAFDASAEGIFSRGPELAFAGNPPDDTGSLVQGPVPNRRWMTVAPWLAAAFFTIVLAGAASLAWMGVIGPPRSRPSVTNAPKTPMSVVRLDSEPEGADVFEFGVRVGRTPVDLRVPLNRPAVERVYTFRLADHLPAVQRVAIDQPIIRVAVVLRAEPVPDVAPPKAQPARKAGARPRRKATEIRRAPPADPGDYKENPY